MRQMCAITVAVAVALLIILFPSVFLPIILALNSRPIDPLCEIQRLTLAADASAAYFAVALKNRNHHRGIRYNAVNLTFSYEPVRGDAATLVAVGGAAFPGFYQGFGKDARRKGRVEFSGDRNLSAAAAAGGYVTFRVELKTAVRFRNAFREEKRVYELEVGADVEVNGEGELVKDEDEDRVELTQPGSSEGNFGCKHNMYLLVVFQLLVLLDLNFVAQTLL